MRAPHQNEDAADDVAALLRQIARCPIVADWYDQPESRTSNPCAEIIRYQAESFGATTLDDFQSPEPWRGDLPRAPLLFLSSNPSIGEASPTSFPRFWWTNAELERYFTESFETEIINGAYLAPANGRRGQYVAFWGGVFERAKELMGPDVQPGRDYALTEVVHCKSRQEKGVHGSRGALVPCTRRYLRRVLSASCARVVVVLGGLARMAVSNELTELSLDGTAVPAWGRIVGPMEIEGRERSIVFMPHPNAHMLRTFSHLMSEDELFILRSQITTL